MQLKVSFAKNFVLHIASKFIPVENIDIYSTKLLVVNIEEVLFSNRTKLNYSRARKGKVINFQNIIFSCSISLIIAVTSFGEWSRSQLQINHNEDLFISFMKKLIIFRQHDLNLNLDKTIILMDNSKINKSKRL